MHVFDTHLSQGVHDISLLIGHRGCSMWMEWLGHLVWVQVTEPNVMTPLFSTLNFIIFFSTKCTDTLCHPCSQHFNFIMFSSTKYTEYHLLLSLVSLLRLLAFVLVCCLKCGFDVTIALLHLLYMLYTNTNTLHNGFMHLLSHIHISKTLASLNI